MTNRAFVSRFSPNRTDPEVLEAIFVQRQRLAEVWLGRLRDSVFTEVKHHLLAVGPRGCGKSHLVALLVSRLRKDPAVRERVRIAWLPEDESTTSFWKFLLRILRALNDEYGDEFPSPPRERIAEATDDRRSAILADYLLKKLDGRTLLVVVENLDDVMRGLKAEGQKRWRAFLQEHPVAATLATAQQLTKDISDRDRPFFNFFQIEHLRPLTTDEALLLLQKIAGHSNNTSLVTFLQTPTGRARVRAIRHLAGGSHRVFIILSEFATRENLDNLVTAFEELLDELTPYYQERLRWLRADQQREIVEFLCRQARTVTVKKIASELFLSEQAAAAQLKQLKEKGYVTAGSVGRESRYELAEPLMRLCVEVKDPQREPIRLVVEFLRVWYDKSGVEARLQCLPADADMERRYFRAVLQAYQPSILGPIEVILDRDLTAARATGDPEEVVRVLVELAATANTVSRCLAVQRELSDLGRHEEALSACDCAIKLDPESAIAWRKKGWVLGELGRYEEALAAFERAIELEPESDVSWHNKGWTLGELGRYEEALAAYDHAIELKPKDANNWRKKGDALIYLERHAEAQAAFDRAIELNPNLASAWSGRGYELNELGKHREALVAYDKAIEIDSKYSTAWNNKGWTLNELGRHEEALAACSRAIELHPKYALAWKNRGRAKLGLGQVDGAMVDLRQAAELDTSYTGALESLAEAHVLQGNWNEAERVLSDRFRLPTSPNSSSKFSHLADFIVSIFRASIDPRVWAYRVGRLAEIASNVPGDSDWKKAPSPGDTATVHAPPSSLAVLSGSLVRSLTDKVYADAPAEALDAWAGVWREVAERHPDLSLAARLFGVGVRYLQSKDERVLLDLVQEERSILRDVFGLDEGTEKV
jgi:tetratricopeptide (TPR) repeat protein